MRYSLGLVVAVASVTGGCHAKFKKYANSIDAVRPQVVMSGGPSVVIGSSGNAIVDVVNGVRSVDVAEKISKQVEADKINAAFVDSLNQTLGSGPPFTTTQDDKAAVLQVEVTNYGLTVPEMGGQGEFVYDLRVRIYMPDGERVYSASLACQEPVTGADAISQVLGTRDNIGNVLDMRRKEIQGAFDDAGAQCGSDLVTKMRRNAS